MSFNKNLILNAIQSQQLLSSEIESITWHYFIPGQVYKKRIRGGLIFRINICLFFADWIFSKFLTPAFLQEKLLSLCRLDFDKHLTIGVQIEVEAFTVLTTFHKYSKNNCNLPFGSLYIVKTCSWDNLKIILPQFKTFPDPHFRMQ